MRLTKLERFLIFFPKATLLWILAVVISYVLGVIIGYSIGSSVPIESEMVLEACRRALDI